MAKPAYFINPIELSTTRVAWEVGVFGSDDSETRHTVSVSMENGKLSIAGHVEGAHLTCEIADALLKLIAPYTSTWQAMAEAGLLALVNEDADE